MADARRRSVKSGSIGAGSATDHYGGPVPSVTWTTTPVQVVNYSGRSGAQLVACGVPIPPGVILPGGSLASVRVTVGGTEQAIYVEKLRGDHPDGSCRALLVQMAYTFANTSTTPITGFTLDFTTASSVTRRTLTTMTDAIQADAIALLPTDAAYLCATRLTLQYLLPASSDPAALVGWYQTEFDARFPYAEAASPKSTLFLSTYDVCRAYLAQWARTGDRKYWREAWLQGRMFLFDWLGASSEPSLFNPESLSGNAAVRAEQHTQSRVGTSLCYYITGWKQYWLFADWMTQGPYNNSRRQTYAGAVERGAWIDDGASNDGIAQNPRFNLINLWMAAVGIRMHCTLPATTPVGGAVAVNFATWPQWMIDSVLANKWGASAEDPTNWRKDITGVDGAVNNSIIRACTAVTATTFAINLSGAVGSLVSNEWVGRPVRVWSGAGVGQKRTMTASTAVSGGSMACTITVDSAFSPVPSVGDTFSVVTEVGDFPAFQLGLVGAWWVLVYTELVTDSRIPAAILAIADAILAQTELVPDGVFDPTVLHGYRYELNKAPQLHYTAYPDEAVEPFTMAMFASTVGFAYAYTGDTTYRTWLEWATVRQIGAGLTGRSSFSGEGMKYFGEMFGNNMDGPFWHACGGTMPTVMAPSALTSLPVYSS